MGPSRAVPGGGGGGGVIGSLEPPQISQILESHASNLTIVATTKKSEPPKIYQEPTQIYREALISAWNSLTCMGLVRPCGILLSVFP